MGRRITRRVLAACVLAAVLLGDMALAGVVLCSTAGAVPVAVPRASRPNAGRTPGAVDPAVAQDNVTQTICVAGYTASVRRVSSEARHSLLVRYHIKRHRYSRYVIDHLIPLELGGSNDVANLWPQRRRESYAKDQTEDALHEQVCAGHLTLAAAQGNIARDWTTARAVALKAKADADAQAASFLQAVHDAQARQLADFYRAVAAAQQLAAQQAAAQQAAASCPNGTYVNSAGNEVCRPYASSTTPPGATTRCRDGTYSFSQSRSGTCSSHGGVAQWL